MGFRGALRCTNPAPQRHEKRSEFDVPISGSICDQLEMMAITGPALRLDHQGHESDAWDEQQRDTRTEQPHSNTCDV
jgi:hypothetical protein